MSSKKQTSKMAALEKTNKMLLQEVSQLRNSETIMMRKIQELENKFDGISTTFQWHTHHRIEAAGPLMFRKHDYEIATGIKLDDNLQPIPPPEPPKTKDTPEE